MSDLVGNPDDGFPRWVFPTLKILQLLHNIIRGTNVLVHILIILQNRITASISKLELILYKDSCAIDANNLES